jgi:excisionase family DNA binding protein
MSTVEHHSEPLLMTQREAAKLLGVSRNTVVRLVERGVLPTLRLAPGMAPLVRRADVVALADSQGGTP